MSLLDGLARLLAARSIGAYDPDGAQTEADWSIWLEHQPSTPGKSIALYEYAGSESPGHQPWDEPNVSVRVRGDSDSRTSRDKAKAVYDLLHGLTYTELADSDSVYVTDCIGQQGGPVHEGPDANGLHVHTVRFRLSVDRPTQHRPAT